MQTVAVVGLGSMGAPMAWNIADEGYDLRVYNRTRARARPFGEAGHVVCDSPLDAAEGADAVVVMVSDGDAVLDVLTGENGILAGLPDGATVVQMSTVSRDATHEAADRVARWNGRFVDAPVSGTIPAAENGTLTVLAGGDDEDVARVRDLLAAMGDSIVDCGDVGDGTSAKLATNLLLGTMMEGFAESLALADAQGIAAETMLEIVDSGGLAAPFFAAKADAILAGDYDPLFPVDLLAKDLDLALAAGGDRELPLPATAATRETVSATRGLGHGDEDMAAVVRYFETVSDVGVSGTGEE